mmetsp:Transcript_72972/g.152348  ORF Transcript_72972/g.152348 Transcript_72972/m.152348 type:complete len:83 (+) Transcript_72972:1555-1803(+)
MLAAAAEADAEELEEPPPVKEEGPNAVEDAATFPLLLATSREKWAGNRLRSLAPSSNIRGFAALRACLHSDTKLPRQENKKY